MHKNVFHSIKISLKIAIAQGKDLEHNYVQHFLLICLISK